MRINTLHFTIHHFVLLLFAMALWEMRPFSRDAGRGFYRGGERGVNINICLISRLCWFVQRVNRRHPGVAFASPSPGQSPSKGTNQIKSILRSLVILANASSPNEKRLVSLIQGKESVVFEDYAVLALGDPWHQNKFPFFI
jgi:hypothetical protein